LQSSGPVEVEGERGKKRKNMFKPSLQLRKKEEKKKQKKERLSLDRKERGRENI